MVHDINQAKLGWVAVKLPWMRNVSVNDADQLDGSLQEGEVLTKEHEKRVFSKKTLHEERPNPFDSATASSLSFFETDAMISDLVGERDLEAEHRALRGLSESSGRSFDGREEWSQCAEVMNHVRDQGKCASCWAQTAAMVIESRLCIGSNGKFSGPNAWISAGYIASCYHHQ